MKERLIPAFIALLLLIPLKALALPRYATTLSYVLFPTEPPSLRGYQWMMSYDPNRFKWRQFNLYFDAGFSHFWVTNTSYYTTLNIYALAPVIRYTFKKHGAFLPYLDLSLGLSYLTHTRLDNRKLGIHFAFQDRLGIGALFGASSQFSIGIHIVHYSNARLSHHNSGITIPLALDVGYRF